MSSSALAENRSELQRLLQNAGIAPSRANGQNFLIDGDAAEALIDAASVSEGDRVLEIGPGLGAVTGILSERGASVTAIELDRRAVGYLKKRFTAEQNVAIIEGDIRRVHLDALFSDGSYKLVSSLPFNITSLVLRRFLERSPRPTVLSLLIQKEVAERATSLPGQMSTLSVSVQYYGAASIVRTVPRESFFPVPEVDGAIIRVAVGALPPAEEARRLFSIVKMGFSSRRKMLHNTLSAGLHVPGNEVTRQLAEIGLNPQCRPQDLSIENWLMLAKRLF